MKHAKALHWPQESCHGELNIKLSKCLIYFAWKAQFILIQGVRAYGNNIGSFATLFTKEFVSLYYFC